MSYIFLNDNLLKHYMKIFVFSMGGYLKHVYAIIVHVHKNSFYVCVGGNHFEFEGQTKVIFIGKHET